MLQTCCILHIGHESYRIEVAAMGREDTRCAEMRKSIIPSQRTLHEGIKESMQGCKLACHSQDSSQAGTIPAPLTSLVSRYLFHILFG